MDKRVKLLSALDALEITADVTTEGNVIDMLEARQAKFGVFFGVVTTGLFDAYVEESDTGTGDWSIIPPDNLIVDATVYNTATTAVQTTPFIFSTRDRENKRFIKLNIISSGSTADYFVSASVALMGLTATVDQTV